MSKVYWRTKILWHGAHGRPHGNIGVERIYHGRCELSMESMTPHGTFSLESFIFNFKLLAPKCSALYPVN